MHVGLCIFFALNPIGSLSKTRIGSFYTSRFIIGPFFLADRLKVSPHLLVSYKVSDEGWSPFQDAGMAKLRTYQAKPWLYNELAEAHFLGHVNRKMKSRDSSQHIFKNKEFKALNSYVIRKVLPSGKIDSVKLVYLLNTYDVKSGSVKSDTSWTLSYKLDDQSVR